MIEPQPPIYLADGIHRRTFLKTLGIASGSLMLSGLPSLHAQIGKSGTATFQLKAPEPNPKYGGTLRYGILSAPAHFDVHQSGTVSNMAAQGPMYDNLIRRHPLDCQTIIPDLAQSWEVAPDGKTYTFFLRQGVQFHDGADFTADDVHATFSRLIFPPKGFSSPRTPLFSAVEAINVRDRHTIEFKLRETRPKDFMLGAFASGWNIIVRKKTLEDNHYSLRQVEAFPGTGPFKHVKRVDKEVWIMGSCTPTLRIIPLLPKPGKMPSSQHMWEGATPWYHTILSISSSCLHSSGSSLYCTSTDPSAQC